VLEVLRTPVPLGLTAALDPTETLAVHCGNGFDARFDPYQSTRLSRYAYVINAQGQRAAM
jgi:hypothetical protein